MVQHDRQGAHAGPVLSAPPRDPRRQRRHMPGAVRKPPDLPKPGHLPGVEHNVTDGVRLPAPVFRPLGHALKGDPDLAAAQVRAPAPGAAAFPPFPAVPSRSVGAGRRRFPASAHRFGQPGRLRLRASRQFLEEPDPGLQLPDQIRQVRELVIPFGKRLPKGPVFRNQCHIAGTSPAIRTRNVHFTVIL